jgi:hypothetical protein
MLYRGLGLAARQRTTKLPSGSVQNGLDLRHKRIGSKQISAQKNTFALVSRMGITEERCKGTGRQKQQQAALKQ